MVEINHDGLTGYGEASLPPYLKEDQTSVLNFLNQVDLSQFTDPLQLDIILDYLNNCCDENYSAKAAVDIALHDLVGKILNVPLFKYLEINPEEKIYSSYTIGISEIEDLTLKIREASQFKFFKIKLGTENDREIIKRIRSITSVSLFVDVNQGWIDKYHALDMINWFKEKNIILVEQPLSKENLKDAAWLKERSPLPIIADEAVQRIDDLAKVSEAYSGVNIKLMKTGGISHAHSMIRTAKKMGLKVMIGCMTETSCAVTAASHLSPLADWVDLDGSELISNDLFSGMKIIEGRIEIPNRPGLGVNKIDKQVN
jgi:L-alanine-DL-glutamate epimerase-like enolase superfamily enzyme